MRTLDELHALPDEALATPTEAGDVLRAPARLLGEWRIQRKGPPFLKVGHLVRYRMGALREWLKSNERATVNRRKVIVR